MTDPNERERRIQEITTGIRKLSDKQLDSIEPVIRGLANPFIETFISPNSDLINKCILESLGDAIRIHHLSSKGPFTKDKFEFSFENAFNTCDQQAKLAPPGNPGYDILINGIKYSLKTEAERAINFYRIHISKFMELGRGEWELDKLRQQFLDHMIKYDRIFTLRRLSTLYPYEYYELLEIPKDLLRESTNGIFRIMEKSKQNPKPGYYDVFEGDSLKFQLYFDGGGERKLQIRKLRREYCIVHAYWKFNSPRPA